MSLTKADREKCWNSRDEFWKCLDTNNDSKEMCSKFRELYESSCPAQWVKHFDRKREYLKFKDRIQSGPRGSSLTEISNPNPNQNTLGSSLQLPSSTTTTTATTTDANSGAACIPTGETCKPSPTSSPNARIYRKFQPQTFS